MVELGAGSGNTVEVIRKAHPRVRYIVIDLAPQLYVSGQFLKAVFGSAVIDYRSSRDACARGELYVPEGGIALLGNWDIGCVQRVGKTLFWSTASLGEMSRDAVAHYLWHVKRFADFIFIMQNNRQSFEEHLNHGCSLGPIDHYSAALQSDPTATIGETSPRTKRDFLCRPIENFSEYHLLLRDVFSLRAQQPAYRPYDLFWLPRYDTEGHVIKDPPIWRSDDHYTDAIWIRETSAAH